MLRAELHGIRRQPSVLPGSCPLSPDSLAEPRRGRGYLSPGLKPGATSPSPNVGRGVRGEGCSG